MAKSLFSKLKAAFLTGYIVVTVVLLGRGVRSLIIAAELVVLWYSVDQFFTTTGIERAVYLAVIQLVLFSAWIALKDESPGKYGSKE